MSKTDAPDGAEQELLDAALAARERAWCRYSGYPVGAALLDERGHVHVGCNVENAAFPLGTCAEAGAIAAMVAAGGRLIHTIVVAGGRGAVADCTPCGGCRQRIAEFADADTTVLVRYQGEWRRYSAAELLPATFHLD